MQDLTIGIHHSFVYAETLLTHCTYGIAKSITRRWSYLVLNWHDYLIELNECDMIFRKLSPDQSEQMPNEFWRPTTQQ